MCTQTHRHMGRHMCACTGHTDTHKINNACSTEIWSSSFWRKMFHLFIFDWVNGVKGLGLHSSKRNLRDWREVSEVNKACCSLREPYFVPSTNFQQLTIANKYSSRRSDALSILYGHKHKWNTGQKWEKTKLLEHYVIKQCLILLKATILLCC